MSRRHAILDLGPPLRIEDLESANGTLVRKARELADRAETNELRPRSGGAFELVPGDRILLGSVVAVVRRRAGKSGEDRRVPGAQVAPIVREPAMQRLYEAAERAARGTISVLLLGETGVGKEVLAREIHRRSPRAQGPFVVIDCAGLLGSVLEGELFGHEKGAFTGATEARPGLFEVADGGTAFLDEIGELPSALQMKLLRVLEERTVTRVGGRSPRRVDVRFIGATNRALASEVEAGTFRRDLFYRVSAMTLDIPPLRERPADIPELCGHFIAEACHKLDRPPLPLSDEARAVLMAHRWPGNIRELRNAMEHAVLLCGGDVITPANLPLSLDVRSPEARSVAVSESARPPGQEPPPARAAVDGQTSARSAVQAPERTAVAEAAAPPVAPPASSVEEIRAALDAMERKRVIEALERCGGNQTRAAEALGISRRTLVTRLGEYGLPRPRKRGAE
ncbi:response regulator receiver protein [Chondromyces apiculatus DSM 436]|uniref:Response regulator receiver protein n=1 Tax=Chondromyces apiculatus DSM 436 TaxID=1192034 RepID=A0A017SW13_9BACT|nr:response regulator receiver protein [Chondromyces apiculatus DSM 436]